MMWSARVVRRGGFPEARRSRSVGRSAVALAVCAAWTLGGAASVASAQDASAPAILQWFEASWRTMERRTPDVFVAGYGSVWTPPPGRALNTPAGGGIGYDVYDRFDLGKARDATLYGTESGYKTMIRQVQRFGGSVYVDFVHHHVGSFDIAPGNSPGPYVQNRSDYPGFILSNVGQENGDTYKDPPNAPSGHPAYEYQYRLARLLTLSFTQGAGNTQYVRNPVPGAANNIPQAPNAWNVPTATTNAAGAVINSPLLRRANTPDATNARFYPDLNGPSRTVIDRGVSYTVHDFNNASPLSGDPVQEDVSGIIMRYAQWLTQSVGVDGLRVDAARHVPLGASGDIYNPTQVDVPKLIDRAVAGSSQRFNLDGSRRSVFQFQEVFNGDPNFLQGFVRKSAQAGDNTQPNRDVLDFPMWFAMRSGLSDNQGNNNWYNIRNASQDNRDDGLAHNGSQSIGFVVNHDEGGVHLSNVAHAWILTRPGNAYVYFRGQEFDRSGNNSFFLKDGRGDSLGGLYGNLVTRLVDIRNSYGRGNFAERWIDSNGFSNVYAYERVGSMAVGLSSFTQGQGVTSFDQRTIYSAFQPGQRLIELTGNAADPAVDPNNQIPEVIVVDPTDNAGLGTGRVTLRIPRNQNVNGVSHGRGYVMYGLPRPVGTLSLSNISQVLAPDTAPTDPRTNTTRRLTSVDVIASDTFTVTMNTQVVTLSDGFTDHRAAGGQALLKINDGHDANGNGSPDFPSSAPSNATRYGFEQFLGSAVTGFVSPTNSRVGTYTQVVNAAALPEGMNYLTVRVFRAQGPAESEIYSDFRRPFYVDRLKPVSIVASYAPQALSGSSRDLVVRSTDLTADSVHVLMNLPASLTESEILALVSPANRTEQIDRDLFSLLRSGVVSGNHVATVVTYEITGTFNVQRFVGIGVVDGTGLGLGDLDASGTFTPADVAAFGDLFAASNTQFNPAGDVFPDGLINTTDLRALEYALYIGGADAATMSAYYTLQFNLLAVPEPSAVALLAPLGLLLSRRRR